MILLVSFSKLVSSLLSVTSLNNLNEVNLLLPEDLYPTVDVTELAYFFAQISLLGLLPLNL